MRSRNQRACAVGAGLALTLLFTACSEEPAGEVGPPTVTASATVPDEPPTSDPSTPSSPRSGPVAVVDTVVTGLSVPWGVDFLPDGTALVTERDTRRVLAVTPGGEVSEVAVISEAAPQGEAGLLGIAVSPDFAEDSSVFLYVTTAEDNRVVRYRFAGGGLGQPEVILDGIPNGFIHDGGRLLFGPDGLLYISTGEIGEPSLAPDLDSLGGKILRITPEGDPAPGNPDPDSPVFSSGHRNVQGLAFDDRDRLWASEFGASTFDELNLVEAGSDYGWPTFEGRGDDPAYTDPQVVWSTDEASPSGLAFTDGHLWMAALRGSRLWRVDVTGQRAQDPTDFFVGAYGRLRTVVVAPDGRLWVTTSNRDGRGEPGPKDDRILVVRP